MKGALSGPFLRLYLLTLLYFSANAILNVIIPLKGASIGASNTAIGVVMGTYLFTTMLFRPWAGQLIHKHGPVKILRAILVINGLALVMYTFTGLEGYFIARMLQGACTAFFSMALQVGIMDALPDQERSQGISLYSMFASIPGIIGPLLAIGLWQGEGYFTAVMIVLAVCTAAAGFSGGIRRDSVKPDQDRRAVQEKTMRNSFPQLIRNREFVRCSILMLAASVVFGAVTTFMPLYAVEVAGGSAAVYLALQAATLVAMRFVLRKKLPSDGQWHPSFIMGIMLAIGAASISISIANSAGAAFLYAGALLMGLAQALLYPILTTYLSFVLPQATRNVQLGFFIAAADLGMSLGGVMMGPLADVFSYSGMYAACSLLSIPMLLFAYGRGKRYARQ